MTTRIYTERRGILSHAASFGDDFAALHLPVECRSQSGELALTLINGLTLWPIFLDSSLDSVDRPVRSVGGAFTLDFLYRERKESAFLLRTISSVNATIFPFTIRTSKRLVELPESSLLLLEGEKLLGALSLQHYTPIDNLTQEERELVEFCRLSTA